MKKLLVISFWLLGLLVLTVWSVRPVLPVNEQTGQPVNGQNPYQKEYDEMLAPCVRITTPQGVGSGVIIHRKDAEDVEKSIYILSAAHVVGNEATVTVEIFYPVTATEGSPVRATIKATVVLTDTNKDLALLRIETTDKHRFTQIYPAKLASKDYKPYLFTPVWAVGCSLGLDPRPSFGHITSLEHRAKSVEGKDTLCSTPYALCWEVSAPILPGNSGGPVYDARTHEVIGITVWVRVYGGQLITTMAGIVPINQIYEFLDSYPDFRRGLTRCNDRRSNSE